MLRVPIQARTSQHTGDLLVRVDLQVLLCDLHGIWTSAVFRVDPGAEITMMAAAEAKRLGLPMPRLPVPGMELRSSSGKAVSSVIRSGLLKVQIVGLPIFEMVIPCFFLGEPDTNGQAPLPPNLLGLSSIVNRLRLTFDGTPAPDARYGVLIVETLPVPNPPSA